MTPLGFWIGIVLAALFFIGVVGIVLYEAITRPPRRRSLANRFDSRPDGTLSQPERAEEAFRETRRRHEFSGPSGGLGQRGHVERAIETAAHRLLRRKKPGKYRWSPDVNRPSVRAHRRRNDDTYGPGD